MKPATVRQAGYTIVEVMIFLVISSALLLSALGLFSGRIQHTQFSQAVQGMDSRIKSVANETSTGTYPSSPAFDCDASSGVPVINPVGATGQQGSRSTCIFAGKIIAPAASCKNGATRINQMSCTAIDIYTVVGRRVDSSTGQVSNALIGAAGAKPRVVLAPNITQTINLGYDTKITGIYQNTLLGLNLDSGVGFFQSFNGSYVNGNLASGSQNVETWFLRTRSVNPISPLLASDMGNLVQAENLVQFSNPGTTCICLKSGNNDQNASIFIGNTRGAVTTKVTIGDPLCP